VDRSIPLSAVKLHLALLETWPRLENRVEFREADIQSLAIQGDDLVVSAHACGALTDAVLSLAAHAAARVAVLPCCHDLDGAETRGLEGWVDKPLAVDIGRVVRLQQRGYRVWTQTIPAQITPKNRLIIGEPLQGR
jgi:hypothetical protein